VAVAAGLATLRRRASGPQVVILRTHAAGAAVPIRAERGARLPPSSRARTQRRCQRHAALRHALTVAVLPLPQLFEGCSVWRPSAGRSLEERVGVLWLE
jgi:hypothetical protein